LAASGIVMRDTEHGPICDDPSGNTIVLGLSEES
jgi:hypothetical protein